MFQKSLKFEGKRDGLVFKTGVAGVGYYPDRQTQEIDLYAALWPTADVQPIKLLLDSVIQSNIDYTRFTKEENACADSTTSNVAGGGRMGVDLCTTDDKTVESRRRGGKNPQPRSLDLHEVEKADESHRKQGLWAIDTVNPNAWPGTADYLKQTSADLCVTQEAKLSDGEDVATAVQTMRAAKWSASITPCSVSVKGGRSAGVAVCTRSHVGVSIPKAAQLTRALFPPGRFMIRTVSAVRRGGFHLGTVYLNSSQGLSKANLDILQAMALTLNLLSGPWVIGGDWNVTPIQLLHSGWLSLVKGVVIAPAVPTCNDSVYDFFVVSESMLYAVHSVAVVGDAGLEPHSPVRLFLRDRPRLQLMRQLVKPCSLPAKLPFGPECEPNDNVEENFLLQEPIDVHGNIVMQIMEDNLLAIAGYDQKQIDSKPSRLEGPRFKWVNVNGKAALDQCRSTPVSRAWRNVVSWLRSLYRAKDGRSVGKSMHKLLHYEHELDVKDPNLFQEKVSFIAWNSLITREMLCNKEIVGMLLEVAIKMADASDTDAAKRSFKKFQAWLHEGAGSGMRNQHRLTRCATGWIPTKVAEETQTNFSEMDDVEGLTQEQTDEVLRSPSGLSITLGAQQSANTEKETWSEEWAVGADFTKPNWEGWEHDEPPPMLVLEKFKMALATFPNNTGLGWDNCHPKALLRLRDKMLMLVIGLLQRCERESRWPECVKLVIIVLLPKPDGGRRSIGLLPLLPRIWMRARNEVVRKWERRNEYSWMYAGEGRGADVAAWKQAARAEYARAIHTYYGQVLLDLVKAFDRIPFHVLAREARRHEYPMWLVRLAIATYKLQRSVRVGEAYSDAVMATRGLTAGSGTATTEMKMVMINIISCAITAYPMVCPCLFVDDTSMDVVGPESFVVKQLVGFTKMVCCRIQSDGMEISPTKCGCSASSPQLGKAIEMALAPGLKIPYAARNKS